MAAAAQVTAGPWSMMCEKAVQWWRGRHLFAIILIYISAEDAWAVGNNIYDYAHIRCVFYSHKLHTENATLWGAVKHRRYVHCFYGGGGKALLRRLLMF